MIKCESMRSLVFILHLTTPHFSHHDHEWWLCTDLKEGYYGIFEEFIPEYARTAKTTKNSKNNRFPGRDPNWLPSATATSMVEGPMKEVWK
jgi:hypothetical protein